MADSCIWTALAWGGRRDLALIHRLGTATTIANLEKERIAITRRGVSRGEAKRIRQPQILGMRMIETDKQLEGTFIYLDARQLPKNTDPYTHKRDSVSMAAFQLPQLIVKQSWQQSTGRFKAVIIKSDAHTGPVFCTRSYFSVHIPESHGPLLEAAWLTLNSAVGVYYLLLTSGRFASFIPEPNKADFLRLPVPEPRTGLLTALADPSEVDEQAYKAFELRDAEQVLIEDLVHTTLRDFKEGELAPGQQPTLRSCRRGEERIEEPALTDYCKYFIRVLKATYGEDKRIGATIFQDIQGPPLPVRLVAIHLEWPTRADIRVEPIESADLCQRLIELNRKYLEDTDLQDGGIFYRRVARVYQMYWDGKTQIPTIYIVKPDRVHYWTRSAGLRDADEVVADIQLSQETVSTPMGAS